MVFPDGTEVEGDATALGEPVHSKAGSLDLRGRVVEGPWEEPMSQLAGHPVRLVRADEVGAGLNEPLTFVSDGSLAMPKGHWEQWLKWTGEAGM